MTACSPPDNWRKRSDVVVRVRADAWVRQSTFARSTPVEPEPLACVVGGADVVVPAGRAAVALVVAGARVVGPAMALTRQLIGLDERRSRSVLVDPVRIALHGVDSI